MIGAYVKTPAEVLDYEVSFADWLPAGDAIDEAEAESSLESVVVGDVTVSGSTVTVWLSGGEDGDSADITVTVTTDDGRTKQECFKLKIKEC